MLYPLVSLQRRGQQVGVGKMSLYFDYASLMPKSHIQIDCSIYIYLNAKGPRFEMTQQIGNTGHERRHLVHTFGAFVFAGQT